MSREAQTSGRRPGSQVHDPIEFDAAKPRAGSMGRVSNRAGGLEGGVTTGEPLVVRGAMKPISTLRRRLPSVGLRDGSPADAAVERSDVCAVPAAGVTGGLATDWTQVVLVGFMGSGKTVVGRLLARELGWSFVDLDRAGWWVVLGLSDAPGVLLTRHLDAQHADSDRQTWSGHPGLCPGSAPLVVSPDRERQAVHHSGPE